MNKQHGFSLLELLVVVSIVGVLASVVLANFADARREAKYTVAREDLRQIATLIEFVKIKELRDLRTITGSSCTECACRNQGNIQLLPQTHACWTNYQALIALLNTRAAGFHSMHEARPDPWGAPYLINQNEGEVLITFPGTCYTDHIASAGPNGIYYDSDDIVYNIPTTQCGTPIGGHHPNVNWYAN